jgi:hypothetical protein
MACLLLNDEEQARTSDADSQEEVMVLIPRASEISASMISIVHLTIRGLRSEHTKMQAIACNVSKGSVSRLACMPNDKPFH